jgi:NAD(P)-dependent dehydrogenase (short-subunit alcohol dehydrogenase family)
MSVAPRWYRARVTDLRNDPILISGGSSGLGAALVDAALRRQARPLVVDRQPPRHEVPHVVTDLADPRTAEDEIRRFLAGQPPLRAVITAAGTDACGRFADVEGARWEQVVTVNLLGTATVIRAALDHLAAPADVVTIASTLGWRVLSDATAYCASKFGVVGFTRALARELDGNPRVTLVVPGGMRTSFFDGRPEQYKPGPDAVLSEPASVADVVMAAVEMPPGIEVKEVVVGPPGEPSWP